MSTMLQEITPRELADLCKQGKADLFDVRTPAEFGEIHATFARSLPLDQISTEKVRSLRKTPESEPIYVICRSGSRGKQACEKLRAAGCHVINVTGGTMAWEQAGLEVVRGKKVMSLERQVRIAAGSLVVLGAVLAATVQPIYVGLGIAGFVGCGLIFAGVTDTCGMGLMLAKMPWNQRSSCSA
ncbi:MAG: rhodanese-like domain-containing protein [Gemmataceae bacterium]